ncbi:MAG: DMT family transporter [Calditrichaeota bacterium]|nr:DMT family transporter [Calditrichota bacterium]
MLSLLTALFWGSAVILFKRSGETVHPLALNIFKNVLAFVLFIPTALLIGAPIWIEVEPKVLLTIMVSGLLGIAISDTLLFQSLQMVGAERSAIIACLYSPLIIGLSHLRLGETLHPLQWLGVVMIVAAVLLTGTGLRSARTVVPDGDLSLAHRMTRRRLRWGILLGVLANATSAMGIVLMKPYLAQLPLIWVSEVRLATGTTILVLFTLLLPGRQVIFGSILRNSRWNSTISGSFLGAYLALLPWLGGLKFAPVSVASALQQLSSVFIFILAAIFLREPVTSAKVIGIMLGLAGSILVMVGPGLL